MRVVGVINHTPLAPSCLPCVEPWVDSRYAQHRLFIDRGQVVGSSTADGLRGEVPLVEHAGGDDGVPLLVAGAAVQLACGTVCDRDQGKGGLKRDLCS